MELIKWEFINRILSDHKQTEDCVAKRMVQLSNAETKISKVSIEHI